MNATSDISHLVPFTSGSSFSNRLFVTAALGGGAPHKFVLDTGSVGILAPRCVLGPNYQNFDPHDDIPFGFISSGKNYQGQWVNVPVVLGIPADWDGTGDYPIAQIDVFAVDQPSDFDGGVFGVGYGIGGLADGTPARNPLLNIFYQGARLNHGYIIGAQGLELGLTANNTKGFGVISLERNESTDDWLQPPASYSVSAAGSSAPITGELPLLVDTGITYMILWLADDSLAPWLTDDALGPWPSGLPFPAGVLVSLSAPSADSDDAPVLQYSFVTGDDSLPMAPSYVEWRIGDGLNTGIHALASDDYLYDATAGRIGFRGRSGVS